MNPGHTRRTSFYLHFFVFMLGCLLFAQVVVAQDNISMQTLEQNSKKASSDKNKSAEQGRKNGDQPSADDQDPLKRPRPETKAARTEKLGGVYKKWLDEDVRWIITGEELSAFKKLTTNAERD
ncbi:MAG: hypothetical protein ACM3SW_05660, partial [Actinomycetota bacterium]